MCDPKMNRKCLIDVIHVVPSNLVAPVKTLRAKVSDSFQFRTYGTLTCSLLLPVFNFLRYFNIFAGSFREDEKNHIVYNPPSTINRLVGVIIQVLVVLHILGTSLLKQQQMSSDNIKFMYKVVTTAYAGFNLSLYYTLNFHGKKLKTLLKKIRLVEAECLGMSYDHSKLRKVQRISHFAIILYFAIVISFSCIQRIQLEPLFEKGLPTFLEVNAGRVLLELNLIFGLQIDTNATINFPNYLNALILCPYFALSVLYDTCWVFGFLLLSLWGISFFQMFKAYFEMATRNSVRSTNEDLSTFIKISFLMDDFNDIHAGSIIFSVLSGSLHFSLYLYVLVASKSTPATSLMTIVTFLIFWIQLFSMAQVHNSAHKIGKILKQSYHKKNIMKRRWEDSTETLEGMMIIFNEIQTGNVGFQGWGFFTVSYSFIGSVISLIATYAIVAMQLNSTQN